MARLDIQGQANGNLSGGGIDDSILDECPLGDNRAASSCEKSGTKGDDRCHGLH
jgi:hypothetical protein